MYRRMYALLSLYFLVAPICYCAPPTKIWIVPIRAEIDPRTSRQVQLGIEEATRQRADILLIDLDTYGGAVADADKIRTLLLNQRMPVWAFINKNAASAGALISIACDSIYMAPGSNIGAATVVMGETGQAAPDKYQSYMRSMMRSTAEVNHRNPLYAEAMVDQSLQLDSSIKKNGKVLTFTTQEAIRNGFCEAQVNNIEEIINLNNITTYEVHRFELGFSEKIIAWFLNPAISSILILLIIGGIYFEMQSPGLGFPSIAAIIAALLYFIPYYLNGLAQNWEILLFFVGLVLLGLEILVIPGFGVAGVAGLILTLGSMLLVMLNNDALDFTFVSSQTLYASLISTAVAFTGGVILVFTLASRLPDSRYFRKVALQNKFNTSDGYSATSFDTNHIGKIGVVVNDLRPVGRIELDGKVYSALSKSDFISKGVSVVVVEADNNILKVRPV